MGCVGKGYGVVLCSLTRKAKGFTLIELLVAMAIVAILAMIVTPVYQGYTQRAYIADSGTTLSLNASRLEARYLDTRSYANDAGACDISMPENTKYFTYQCVIPNNDNQRFELSATSTSALQTDKTLVLSINEQGHRQTSLLDGNTQTAQHDCWLLTETGVCQ